MIRPNSMVYFRHSCEALDGTDLDESAAKVPVPDTDNLPFDLLGDRRFEVLAYRIKAFQHGSRARVALMQGVGERGRDVVVYNLSGRLIEIVQCKNHRDRLTAPDLRRELIKLSLHAFLERAILGPGPVQYELWCPRGLSEQAAKLVHEWPNSWDTEELARDAGTILRKVAAFKGLDWEASRDFVTKEFASILLPTLKEGVDLSAAVRACLPVFRSYFEATIVMDQGAVQSSIRSILEEAGLTPPSDRDVGYLSDRIRAFSAEKRLALMTGYVMGLTPDLVSKFNNDELAEFAKATLLATTTVLMAVTRACGRLANEAALEFRLQVAPSNKSISLVVAKLLAKSMLARVADTTAVGSIRHPLATYGSLSLEERIEHNIIETWDQMQRCLARYDPKKHQVGSDEETRNRIARNALDGATDRLSFENSLRQSAQTHSKEIRSAFDQYMRLVPDEVLVVTDTQSIFKSDILRDRMHETLMTLEALRGED